MCMGPRLMLIIWGLAAHIGMWSVLVGRPGAWLIGVWIEAAAFGLVLVRGIVRRFVPDTATQFHESWEWDGFGGEALEVVLLGPLYFVFVAISLVAISRPSPKR